eukprot:4242908-Prorocentrum_lima.AAC.1
MSTLAAADRLGKRKAWWHEHPKAKQYTRPPSFLRYSVAPSQQASWRIAWYQPLTKPQTTYW